MRYTVADPELEEFLDIMEILELPALIPFLTVKRYRPRSRILTREEMLRFHSEKHKPIYEMQRPSHSFTRNYYNLLVGSMCAINSTDNSTFGDDHINLKNTAGSIVGGTTRGVGVTDADYFEELTNGDTTRGIIVGTGNAPESFDDYILGSMVANGDGAGQMRYYGHVPVSRTWSGGTRQWTSTYRRYCTNHSGGSITIQEIGLVAGLRAGAAAAALIARDVLAASVPVADGELLQVEYQMVSAVWPS